MRAIPVLLITVSVLAGCGGGGGGGTPGPGPGPIPTVRLVNDSGAAVAGVTLVLRNSAGAEVGRVVSGTDGGLRGVTPPTATRFDVLLSDAQQILYYNQFDYLDESYSVTVCPGRAPLATTSASGFIRLSGPVTLTARGGSQAPPPPPTCGL